VVPYPQVFHMTAHYSVQLMLKIINPVICQTCLYINFTILIRIANTFNTPVCKKQKVVCVACNKYVYESLRENYKWGVNLPFAMTRGKRFLNVGFTVGIKFCKMKVGIKFHNNLQSFKRSGLVTAIYICFLYAL
jgi:hypothetical protein